MVPVCKPSTWKAEKRLITQRFQNKNNMWKISVLQLQHAVISNAAKINVSGESPCIISTLYFSLLDPHMAKIWCLTLSHTHQVRKKTLTISFPEECEPHSPHGVSFCHWDPYHLLKQECVCGTSERCGGRALLSLLDCGSVFVCYFRNPFLCESSNSNLDIPLWFT